jgi:hypothetical protein
VEVLNVKRVRLELNLNSEVEQVVLVLLLVLVLENSRYLTVTLIERSSAGRFGPCFDAGSQKIEHEHDDEHDSLTSESGFSGARTRNRSPGRLGEATLPV